MKPEYTDYYINSKIKFEQAEIQFDKNPCKHTAKILSDLRNQLKNISDEDKYTKQYLLHKNCERAEYHQKQVTFFKNLLGTIDIEHRFKSGKIDNQTRITQHQINDGANPY